MRVHEAEAIVAEERTWVCDWCDRMVEEGEAYCFHCKQYREDVAAGLFDDPIVPDPCDWFGVPGQPLVTTDLAPGDYLDTYEVLALAAAELKCAADVIYATRSIPEAMLDTALARLDAAAAAVRAIKERTTA